MLASSVSSPTAYNQQDNIKLEETTWSTYKAKRTNVDLYEEDATVVFVPTSVGTRGSANIRRFFLHHHFSEKNVSVREEVYNVIASNYKLFEEATWTIHFHTPECNWLVPQLDERFLVDATIKVLMTTSVAFDKQSNKIASIRYYWDQASVLKQLKVISDKVNWPVVAEQQVQVLGSLDSVKLKDLNGEFIHADHKTEPTKTNSATTSRNIFTYQPPPERRLVAPSNKLNSSFTFGHDDGSGNIIASKLAKTSISQQQPLPTTGRRSIF